MTLMKLEWRMGQDQDKMTLIKTSKKIENEKKMENKKQEQEKDFKPREYQVEILDKCLRENTIVYMPTGSGKTFIASMLIKCFGKEVEKKFSEGGRRIFFLVNTVTLVNQQASAIKAHLPYKIGRYSGDMGVDHWDKAIWTKELDSHQIFVMTAQIFLNLLLHKYIKFDDVALLILDECHHATKDHCMSQIMREYSVKYEVSCSNQTHVLGLTATLLNANCKSDNVDAQIKQLEAVLHSKIVTSDNREMVQKFSTNPIEKMVIYRNDPNQPRLWRMLLKQKFDKMEEILASLEFEDDPVLAKSTELGVELAGKGPWKKRLRTMLEIVIEINGTMGLFAASKAMLVLIVRIERLLLSRVDVNLIFALNAINTELHFLRKLMSRELRRVDPKYQPLMYCTDKLRNLFEIAQKLKETDHSIVFVEQRVTAKVLFYIFEDLQKLNEDFKNIKPDFIVGFNNNPMNDTREMLFERKKNIETLEKFRTNKTNILFSSEVIEEGIDIPLCNYVVKFDFPKTYRSYVQSKGRARHRDSQFLIFIDSADEKFRRIYPTYQRIELSMFERLGFCDEIDEDDELDNEYIEPYQPFGPSGPKITALSAISLVNRYCSLLPQDKFSALTASWWSKPIYITPAEIKRIVSVRLPINSCISEVVQSDPFSSNLNAKRSAALKVCVLLHERGEFDESLLPVGSEAALLGDETLFPWWNHNEGDNEKSAGTRKIKRNYKKIFPSWLSECRPEPNVPLFVHVLEVIPDYSFPEHTRDKAFYHLLNSPNQFSILSTKELPQVCSYQLYLSVGKVNVNVKVNAAKVVLTQEQIDQLFEFHTLLFTSVIQLVQLFMVKDFDNDDNSFFIVPTRDGVFIDWEVINNHKSIPPVTPILPENRRGMTFKTSDYNLKIVVPWYRPEGYTTRYVVTRVCENETPSSPFPSENFQSYNHYFKSRYSLTVENENQPLLEVRAISSRLNCLLPRSKHKSKRRQKEEQDFEEFLIPEFCTLVDFPSIYMVKATLLPSVIHRLHHLLLAEELRQKIAVEVGLGPMKGQHWLPLTIDEYAVRQEESSQRSTIAVSNQLASSMKSLMKDDYPWEPEEEPYDVERHLSELDLISLIRFQKFVNSPLSKPITSPPHSFSYSHTPHHLPPSRKNGDDTRCIVVDNSLQNVVNKRTAESLKQKAVESILSMEFDKQKGPELCEVLQSLTAKTACDIINYERLETLGDSFLKFITSLALFTYYKLDEGKLTQVKGKIVGNRNLFYSGYGLNLGSYMKIYDFSPNDWDIPCFSAEKILKHLLREKNISPAVFHDIVLTKEEKRVGVYSNENLEYISNLLESQSEDVPASSNLSLIGMQSIGDKVIADCIEALIGLYLKSCGIIGALKLCNWLGIIVPEISEVEKLFSPPEDNTDRNLNFLNEPNKIEETLNYKFKNRGYLLQALTHSSFITGVSECYQRLEFLGDAIIDFLITVHIYENCGNLSPGELTDLRSALVNNVTFACLVVRYGLHLHMNFHACRLSEMINRFVVHQKNRNHEIGPEVLFLVEEDDVQIAEIVDIPKVLGDIFESLIGAVYLDSGKCLKTTWKVIHHLMKNEIESFSKNVPKNHIRVLYEKFPNPPPRFGKSVLVKEGQSQVIIPLSVTHNREAKTFHGVGKNKSQAKLASAKLALRYYSSKPLQN